MIIQITRTNKEKCGSRRHICERDKTSHNYLTNVFQGKSYFSQKDIDRGSEVLGIIPNEIGVIIFLTKEVHKNETK